MEKSGGGGRAIGSGCGAREGAREGKATVQADLFSPNVRGFLMKLSTLLGIFQDTDADLSLPASPTPPSLAQTASGEGRHKELQSCASREREKGGVAPAHSCVHSV